MSIKAKSLKSIMRGKNNIDTAESEIDKIDKKILNGVSNIKKSKQKTQIIEKKSGKSSKSTNPSKLMNPTKLTKIIDSTDSDSVELTDIMIEDINLNQLIYPCKDVILYTRVTLLPHQINNDLYINLKKNLIDKIEGKCIKDGYIIKIYKILEYKNGIIEPENFSGSAIYDIKYLAKICVALKESTIIAKITSYITNANLILAEFGPIIKIILAKNKRDLNEKNFIIGNDKSILHQTTQRKIGMNDYVKIQLKSIKFHHNDTVIKCMGYLDDIAYPEDIEKYAYMEENTPKIHMQKYNEINSTIHFNDDNEQENKNIDDSLTRNQIDTLSVKNNKMSI